MKFTPRTSQPDQTACDCLAVAVFKDQKLSPSARAVDRACGGLLTRALMQSESLGAAGSAQTLTAPPGIAAPRVLLVGFGELGKTTAGDFIQAVTRAAGVLTAGSCAHGAIACADVSTAGGNLDWKLRQAAMIFGNASYHFCDTKPSAKAPKQPLKEVSFLTASSHNRRKVQKVLDEGSAIASGMTWARHLGDLPPNICTPTYLAEQAKEFADAEKRVSITVLSKEQLAKRNMGALLAVAQGSVQAPKLIMLDYRGGGRRGNPIVLVGKGVTFDTGGISIKPSSAMDEMKYDMCGAASVLGTLKACAAMNLPLRVMGVIPTVENMPSGHATRPGDVVTSASGQTVEILNTDAEGRLILCDALDYATKFKPKLIIDIATLTGACVAALGKHASGLMTQDAGLERKLTAAGRSSWDRVWSLPLWDDYQSELDSNFADIANIGSRYAGATTAACFLSRFVKDYPWAHLDIAGTAWLSGKRKGATGRPVPLLTHFLMKEAKRL